MFFKKNKPKDVGDIVKIPHLGSRLTNIEPNVVLPDSETIRREIDSGKLEKDCESLLEQISTDKFNRGYFDEHITSIAEADKGDLNVAIARYWSKMRTIVNAQTEEQHMISYAIEDVDFFINQLEDD